MAASEYVLIISNSIELLYLGSATVTRTAATAPSRRTLDEIVPTESLKALRSHVQQGLPQGLLVT